MKKELFTSDCSLSEIISALKQGIYYTDFLEELIKKDQDTFDSEELKKLKYFKITIEEIPIAN